MQPHSQLCFCSPVPFGNTEGEVSVLPSGRKRQSQALRWRCLGIWASPGFVSRPSASQNKSATEPVEELTYRRSLRVALDLLNERSCLLQESCSREEGTAGSAGEKHTGPAASLCDPSSSSSVHEGVLGSSGPERRERIHLRLAGSPTCEKDPKCQVDHKKGLGESESPLALMVSAGGGSRDRSGSRLHLENLTTPNKRGRSSVQEPGKCQNGPSVSEGHQERENEEEAGGRAALSSPARIREHGLWAKGHFPALPCPTLRPVCPDVRGSPAKQLCRDGDQRSGPQDCMTLRSATRLGPPAPRTPADNMRLQALEGGKACLALGQGGALVLPPDSMCSFPDLSEMGTGGTQSSTPSSFLSVSPCGLQHLLLLHMCRGGRALSPVGTHASA